MTKEIQDGRRGKYRDKNTLDRRSNVLKLSHTAYLGLLSQLGKFEGSLILTQNDDHTSLKKIQDGRRGKLHSKYVTKCSPTLTLRSEEHSK